MLFIKICQKKKFDFLVEVSKNKCKILFTRITYISEGKLVWSVEFDKRANIFARVLCYF